MRRRSRAIVVVSGLALIALAGPAAPVGGAAADKTPPKIELDGRTDARCQGKRTRLEVRVTDASPTRTVAKLDGRVLRRTAGKRFALDLRLGSSAHVIRVAARDARGNRFSWSLRLRRCPTD